jgi:hypothetical protein
MLAFLLFFNFLYAKKITLNWDAVKGATSYEIEIILDGKVVDSKKIIDKTKYKKELDPGIYQYRIRTYDWAKRAGEWSPSEVVAILPEAPKLLTPTSDFKKLLPKLKEEQKFEWEKVKGIEEYYLEVSKGTEKIFSQNVKGTSQTISLSSGKYDWKVKSLLKKKVDTEYSSTNSFELKQVELIAPKIEFPSGRIAPISKQAMKLKWKNVDHAEAYEVELFEGEKSLKKWTTKENQVVAEFETSKKYQWKVRAVASIENNVPKIVGDYSTENFKMDKNAGFADADATLQLGFGGIPSSYNISVASLGQNQGNNFGGYGVLLKGNYWLMGTSGFELNAAVNQMHMNNQGNPSPWLESGFRGRTKIGDAESPLVIMPFFGGEVKHYKEVLWGNGNTYNALDFGIVGMSMGFDIRKYFSRNFYLGISGHYFIPMSSFAAPADFKIGDGLFYANALLGVASQYWFSRNWAIGLNFQYERSAVQYFRSSDTIARSITIDGYYMGTNLTFAFGR